MKKIRPYRIEYTKKALAHLAALSARERGTVADNVDRKLVHEPQVETRNRKVLRMNEVAAFELRLGELRVYYSVDEDERKVLVEAVGVKDRGVVRIGGEEVDL